VITVHGFNSPRDAVLKTYAQSFQSVNGDKALHDRGVICVGYRWPSERMGTPWRSGLTASPIFLLGTLFTALAAVYFVNFVLELCEVARIVRMLITAATAFMAVIPITLYLLRLSSFISVMDTAPRPMAFPILSTSSAFSTKRWPNS